MTVRQKIGGLVSFYLFLSAVLLAACGPRIVSADIASYKDPAFVARSFSSFIVQVDAAGLSERQWIEKNMAQALQAKGAAARESYLFLSPTRDYTKEQAQDILARSNYQAVLRLTPSYRKMRYEYIPPVYYPGRFDVYGPPEQPFISYEEPYFQGGYYVGRPITRYHAVLHVMPSFEKVWTAEISLGGSAESGFPFLDTQMPAMLAERMSADRLISYPQTQKSAAMP